ncbi:unnamed protein product [Amoebophrya sp. A120]|nr:unnamed protein product [Amoebophrya sp. A120]|eukprot:GSA120T00010743001.1
MPTQPGEDPQDQDCNLYDYCGTTYNFRTGYLSPTSPTRCPSSARN